MPKHAWATEWVQGQPGHTTETCVEIKNRKKTEVIDQRDNVFWEYIRQKVVQCSIINQSNSVTLLQMA